MKTTWIGSTIAKNLIGFAGLVVAVAANVQAAEQQKTIIPPAQANTPGFSKGYFDSNARQGLIYSSSYFQNLPAGGVMLQGMAFRVNLGVSETTPITRSLDIEVYANITSQSPAVLGSPVHTGFWNELAPNSGQLIVSRQSFEYSTVYQPGIANPFVIEIPFTTPFFYNPSQGNLLIDIRSYKLSGSRLDTDLTPGSATIRSHVEIGDYGGTGPGPVVEFTYTAVPEPTAAALVVIGLFGLTLSRRSK